MWSPIMLENKTFLNYLLFCLIAVFPIVIIVTQIISWIAFSNQNYALALKINALPVLNVLIIIIIGTIDTYF